MPGATSLGISPGGTTYPILLSCDYSKGKFYVLTIPNDPADLYAFPPAVLSVIRERWVLPNPSALTAPPRRSPCSVTTTTRSSCRTTCPRRQRSRSPSPARSAQIQDLLTGKDIPPAPATGGGFGGFGRGFGGFGGRGPAAPPRTSFTFTVLPHSYMAFAAK